MESIITLVGFLGAGKTTLLKHLIERALEEGLAPFVILNDYIDADLDAQQLSGRLGSRSIQGLTGSCICCDGINELRHCVNGIAQRDGGITFIEANGTSDASRLMEFLGVGVDKRFLPPIQVSVVDVKNWQKRGVNNELEAEQIKVSSLIVLTHQHGVEAARIAKVEKEVRETNPYAEITTQSDLDVLLLSRLKPVDRTNPSLMSHKKTHWSSCSVDLQTLPSVASVQHLCELIPAEILRVKGCTRIGGLDGYIHFERCPDGEVYLRPYYGAPVTGPKLLAVGPGSEPDALRHAVETCLQTATGVANPAVGSPDGKALQG
jgi:G3E family GTPase